MATQPLSATAKVNVPPMEPSALPPSSWKVGSRPETAVPCESTHTTHRMDSSPPRVTTNDGTPT